MIHLDTVLCVRTMLVFSRDPEPGFGFCWSQKHMAFRGLSNQQVG